MINASEFAKALKLSVLSPSTKEEFDLEGSDLNRPGLQFSGFFDYFAYERPQVMGKVEITFLNSKSEEERKGIYQKFFAYEIPCIICCRNMVPPDDFLAAAKAADVPVYKSPKVTSKFIYAAITYLNRVLAPRVTRHGVLVDVYGVGVLITGNSGIGKSETALELVKRGHQLVADDVVDIVRVADNRLVGECP